jgi:hypothetical protein
MVGHQTVRHIRPAHGRRSGLERKAGYRREIPDIATKILQIRHLHAIVSSSDPILGQANASSS